MIGATCISFSRTECRIMVKAPAVFLLSLALAGCAMAPQAHLAQDPAFGPARYAWDGAGGEDPNYPKRAAEGSRPTRAAALPAQDGLDPDQDEQLGRRLVICNGCLPTPKTEDARLAKAAD
jgi:hypothetical protein